MSFFLQAEAGIRDVAVTGVQTCALPIYGGFEPPSAARGSKPPSAPRRPNRVSRRPLLPPTAGPAWQATQEASLRTGPRPSSTSSAVAKWTLPSSNDARSAAVRPCSGSPNPVATGAVPASASPAGGGLRLPSGSAADPATGGVAEEVCDSVCVGLPQPKTANVPSAIATIRRCMVPPFLPGRQDACGPVRSFASVHRSSGHGGGSGNSDFR